MAADGLGMHAEVAADGGAGLAGEVVLLGLALLLVAQAARPTGDTAGIAEVADLLLADAVALADLTHRHALLVEGDHLILLRWRKAGVMLAEALRRGSGYGSRGGSVVGGCQGCGRGDSSVVGGSSGGDFALGRQRPGELQQRLPVLGDRGKEGHQYRLSKLLLFGVVFAFYELVHTILSNRQAG